MIALAVIGGVVVVIIALAAVSGYRNRRRGRISRPFGKAAFQNRMDVETRANPYFVGGQDWTPHREQDPRR